VAGGPAFVPESPFLESTAFASFEDEAASQVFSPSPWSDMESPFLNQIGDAAGATGEAGDITRYLAETYEEEFNEAVHELVNEGFAADDRPSETTPQAEAMKAERRLTELYAPVERAAEQMYERLAEHMSRFDAGALTEAEVEATLEQAAPTPAGEQFIGKLWRKAKRAVGGAIRMVGRGVSAVGRAVLGPIIRRLKKLVRPLLRSVIRFALNRLPTQLRPLAQRLARRLFGQGVAGEVTEAEQAIHTAALATHDAAPVQLEFDLATAEALLEAGRPEGESPGNASGEAEAQSTDPVTALRDAHERFVQQFTALAPGQDPKPLLEEFIPAAIMALRPIARAAVAVIGRQRVVNFLAKFLAKLITRFVGQEGATQLSRAVVSIGLKLLGMEAPVGGDRRVAGETLAATLEQTLVNLSQEPESVFANEFLMETAAQEAFEQAALANFPQSLLRPDLLQQQVAGPAPLPPGMWVSLPRGGRTEYKKFSQVVDRTIRPETATAIRTFGNATLADFFRDYLGLPEGRPVTAKVHLYEAVFGTWLGRIAQLERTVPGLGSTSRVTRAKFHPLTTHTALALDLGGVGVDVPEVFLAGGEVIAIKQRFFYLELPGQGGGGGSACARVSQVSVSWDLGRGEIRFGVYLSEAHAQQVATRLRQGQNGRAAATLIFNVLRAGLNTAVAGQLRRRDREVIEAVNAEQFLGAVLGRVVGAGRAVAGAVAGAGGAAAQAARGLLGRGGATAAAGGGGGVVGFAAEQIASWLIGKLLDWVTDKLMEFLTGAAQDLIRAADNAACGLTLMVKLTRVPAAALIQRAFRGDLPSPADLFRAATGQPAVEFRVQPGFHAA